METRKIHFDPNNIGDAVDIVKQHIEKANSGSYDSAFHLSMVPSSILYNPDFWIPLLEENPYFIYDVPKVVFTPDFVSRIDRVKFYEMIPRHLLTAEDFYNFREAEKGYSLKKTPFHTEVESEECDTWIRVGNSWFSSKEISKPEFWMDYIRYGKEKESYQYLKEYFTENIAEAIWNSPYWYIGYNLIPEHFVTDVWKKIKAMYEKRIKIRTKSGSCLLEEIIRNDSPRMKLIQFYKELENEDELLIALEAERKIVQSTIKLPGYLYSEKYCKKFYLELWDAMPVKNIRIATVLKELFPGMVLFIPEEYFQKEDLIQYLKSVLRIYRLLYRRINNPLSCEVDKLEAKEDIKTYFSQLKVVIQLRYPTMDDASIEAWINDACNLL